MAENDQQRGDPAGLRRRAEELWHGQAAARRDPAQLGAGIPLEEALNLLHELEVHQIELEMQNEELRRVQEELTSSRARYFTLYDLAPVGYLTLSEEGLILEANLTAAHLLGLERSELVKRPLAGFIVPEDQDIYYLYRQRLAATARREVCELRMVRGGLVPPVAPTERASRDPRRPLLRQGGATGQAAPDQNSSGWFWVRLEATVTPSGADAPVWRVTLSDITEQKRAEDALRHAHDDLELRVHERTAANAALQQSRDQLQSLTRRLVQAQESERAAIARELHDGAGQILFAMSLDLSKLAQNMTGDPVSAARVQRVRDAAEELTSELHTLAANLHPVALARLGLVGAVREHISTLQKTASPQLRVEALGLENSPLTAEVELAIYRVIQEAVNNALRHAQARSIDVVLQTRLGHLLVTVEDDGNGFKPESASASRMGLLTMHERIELLGGSLSIKSVPGAGTTVSVEMPL